MNRFIKPLQFVFKFIVPACFLTVLIIKILSSKDVGVIVIDFGDTLEILYKILLASMVGYFTNFLAITMLFKPMDKTRHGVQGLIPNNQDQIAESMGAAIEDNFFESKDLTEYLRKNDVISSSITSLKNYVDETLDNQQSQEKITEWILNTFQANSPKIFSLLLQLSEINLSQFLKDKIDLNVLIKEVIKIIEKNINDGTINLKTISKELTQLIHQNIPEISNVIYKQMNKAIEKQGTFKRGILKLATWTFDFDQMTIEENLYEMVSSPNFRYQIYENLEKAVKRLSEYLNTNQGTREFNIFYQRLVVDLDEKIRSQGVPFLMTGIENFLKKETSWKQIEVWLKKFLGYVGESLENMIENEKFDRLLDRSMPKILERINISSIVTEKVKAFDTSKLEKMVLDASGEHLSAIEVLGGILGGFAGIALFDPLLFLYILGPLILLGFTEYFWTKKQKKN